MLHRQVLSDIQANLLLLGRVGFSFSQLIYLVKAFSGQRLCAVNERIRLQSQEELPLRGVWGHPYGQRHGVITVPRGQPPVLYRGQLDKTPGRP